MPTRTCPECDGKGYVSIGDVLGGTITCSECKGEGEVYR
jgi:DnaJ-class molecular chaperone